jgi:ribosome-associated protein YbcJ (S4-like RNA binding protein)
MIKFQSNTETRYNKKCESNDEIWVNEVQLLWN